jgi:hypothetical protein
MKNTSEVKAIKEYRKNHPEAHILTGKQIIVFLRAVRKVDIERHYNGNIY